VIICLFRYYTVPKKETKKFHRDSARSSADPALVRAVENALAFLDKDVLPVHWDREILFNMREESSTEGSSEEDGDSLDSEDEDTESPEEKDHLGKI
jgi:Ras-related protein Rab-1A